jgi:hypothetical protein
MSDQKSENYAETAAKVIGIAIEKTVVPIYEDFAKPSLKQIGDGLGGFLGFAMTPLQMMGYQAEHWKSEFKKSLDRKAQRIPEENLQAPAPVIVGPIMQALGYTVHEEPLREMFTSLLATAMDSETAKNAHPAFVEIIKQISPDEAKILIYMSKNYISPVVDIKRTMEDGGYQVIYSNQSFIPENSGCSHTDLGPIYLDNLCRLRIMEIPPGVAVAPNLYEKLESWFDEFEESKEVLANGNKVFRVQRKIISLTEFGKQFISACIKDLKESHHE